MQTAIGPRVRALREASSLSLRDLSQIDGEGDEGRGGEEDFETEELLETVRKNTAFAEELAQVRLVLYFWDWDIVHRAKIRVEEREAI